MEVQVEAIDKAGNFIGWLFVDNTNISVALVEVTKLTHALYMYGQCSVSAKNVRSPNILPHGLFLLVVRIWRNIMPIQTGFWSLAQFPVHLIGFSNFRSQ